MKKRIIIGVVLLIVSIVLIRPTRAGFEITMEIEGNSNNIVLGEEFVYEITANETIVACNFNITYDKEVLEFVESATTGLSAAVNGDVVSCVYFDATGTGTNKFKVKFKAIKNADSTSMQITNVKFRGKDKDTSYVASDTKGLDNPVNMAIPTSTPTPTPTPTPTSNFKVTANIDGNLNNIEIGKQFIYKLSTNETIVGCNFNIKYDNKVLKFIGSETTGLNADVNGDVVSCIYADVSQKGTQEFKLKFEVIAETKETSLGITNVKFRAKDKESSYTEKDTQGINDALKIATVAGITKISTITPTPTLVPAKTGKLPNAGAKEQTGYVLLVCSILLIASAVFKEKERKIKRILKDVGM